MTIVYKDDLVNETIPLFFENVATSTNNVARVVDGFINSSNGVLQGNGYDAIRMRMLYFNDALLKSSELCELFANNLRAANAQLADYMGELDVIDDSLIGETQNSLDQANADLERLESYYLYTERNSEGRVTYSEWRRVGTDAQIAECKELIAYLEYLLNKMIGLVAADDGAYSLLNDVTTDIDSFGKAVSGMSIQPYKVDFMSTIDTSDLTSEEIDILEQIVASWPDDLSDQRKDFIALALSYLHQGHRYSQGHGPNVGEPYKGTETPDGGIYMDCSYYTSDVLMKYAQQAGLDSKITKYTYTGGWKQYGSKEYNDNLQPGDFAMYGSGDTHIAIYLGTVDGKRIFIDCSSNKNPGAFHGNDEAVRIITESSNVNNSDHFSFGINLDNMFK